MIDLVNRLHLIRNHLRTGAVGQREVWEEWLAEAADEIDQLTGSKNALQVEIDRLRKLNDDQQAEMLSWHMQLTAKDEEIERLKADGDGLLYEELMKATAEIERLHAAETHDLKCKASLRAEVERLRKILDGTERREAEYLALVEKHATDAENLRKQIGSAEQMVYDSGFKLGEAHKLLHERNDEIARLRGYTTKLLSENERLKAERDTTKRMLKDILDKHGYSGWDAART